MHYHDASTLFPSNLCHHRLRQRNYITLRTVMTSSNPLSDILKDENLPQDALTTEKIMRQEGHYFLSDNDILYRQSHAGKRNVMQLVTSKTLQTELLRWYHDHFTFGHLGLSKTYERLRSTYFWNNMFADLQRWIESCVFCAQKKRDVHDPKPPLLLIAAFWQAASGP